MTNETAPPLLSVEEATARLLSPGSPFELAEESVLGETMQVYKNRARSLRDLLARSADHGDNEYLVFSDGRRWSFAEHLADVASIAAGLRERYDIQPGDRVAILAANAPEWILAYWATVSLGGVVIAGLVEDLAEQQRALQLPVLGGRSRQSTGQFEVAGPVGSMGGVVHHGRCSTRA